MRSHLLPTLLVIGLLGLHVGHLGAAQPPGSPATIVVLLPEDALLTVDDVPTRSTTASRTLVTPPLQGGKAYRYVLKAELVRAGKTVTVQDVVTVRAGRETVVSLHVPRESEGGIASPGLRSQTERTSPYRAARTPGAYREYSGTSSTVSSSDFRIAPMNEQDSMIGFGPPGLPEYSK